MTSFLNQSEETYHQTEELKDSRKNVPFFFPKPLKLDLLTLENWAKKVTFAKYFENI